MDVLKKIFPYAFGTKDVTGLVIKVIVQVVVGGVIDIALGLIGQISLFSFIAGALAWLIGVYFTCSIVVTFLAYFKVIK